MRVGLNLIYLVPGETGGMETYARELIAALAGGEDLQITAFVNRTTYREWERPATEGVHWVAVPVDVSRRVQWVRAEQQLLPPLARKAGVDVLHSLASTAPLWGHFARVVTIHDVIYRLYPEAHFGLRAIGMGLLVPSAARRSDRIIVPSLQTKSDLVSLLKVPEQKIDVVPQGVRVPPTTPTDEAVLRTGYSLGQRRIVLAASAKRPHKNLAKLLEALALLPSIDRPLLVLPGYPTPYETELRGLAARLELADDTRFLGWISAGDLEGLYRLASCFVFPSLYEGFGLPVLEAMARGVPVACSARASLTEVAGDAACLFDPEKPAAIAAAIRQILEDEITADRLRAAGREQAGRFTWAATARKTVQAYCRAKDSSA